MLMTCRMLGCTVVSPRAARACRRPCRRSSSSGAVSASSSCSTRRRAPESAPHLSDRLGRVERGLGHGAPPGRARRAGVHLRRGQGDATGAAGTTGSHGRQRRRGLSGVPARRASGSPIIAPYPDRASMPHGWLTLTFPSTKSVVLCTARAAQRGASVRGKSCRRGARMAWGGVRNAVPHDDAVDLRRHGAVGRTAVELRRAPLSVEIHLGVRLGRLGQAQDPQRVRMEAHHHLRSSPIARACVQARVSAWTTARGSQAAHRRATYVVHAEAAVAHSRQQQRQGRLDVRAAHTDRSRSSR